MQEKQTANDVRGRVWTFVFYPDSAPGDWRRVISGWKVEAYVSPLHDKDLDGDNGAKKAHRHVVLVFSGKKSAAQVQEFSDLLSGVCIVPGKNRVADKRAMVRYLVHRDNPEKSPYEIGGIIEFGGADKLRFFDGEGDTDDIVREMMAFCRERCVCSFAALSDYAAAEKPEWFRVLVSRRSYFMDKYLRSLAFEYRK